jgi:hypothetical protein
MYKDSVREKKPAPAAVGQSAGKGIGDPAASPGPGGGSGKPTAGRTIAATTESSQKSASTAEQRQQLLTAKLHPVLVAVVERLRSNNPKPGPDENKFVRKGKVRIQIVLADISAETLAALKALGFKPVLESRPDRIIIGRIPIEKLDSLVDLDTVRYVSPIH